MAIRLLRDSTGNHNCRNCEQRVFATTPFNKFWFFFYIFAMAIIMISTLNPTASISRAWSALGISIFIVTIVYTLYWYFIKNPICPMCRSRNFKRYNEASTNNRNQGETTYGEWSDKILSNFCSVVTLYSPAILYWSTLWIVITRYTCKKLLRLYISLFSTRYASYILHSVPNLMRIWQEP